MSLAEEDVVSFASFIGRGIRRLRKDRGFSQEAVARRTGIDGLSKETVRRIELGLNTTCGTVDQILLALGATPEELVVACGDEPTGL